VVHRDAQGPPGINSAKVGSSEVFRLVGFGDRQRS